MTLKNTYINFRDYYTMSDAFPMVFVKKGGRSKYAIISLADSLKYKYI